MKPLAMQWRHGKVLWQKVVAPKKEVLMRSMSIIATFAVVSMASAQDALSLRDAIMTQGFPEYIENTIDASTNLQRIISPSARLELLSKLADLRGEAVVAVEAQAIPLFRGFVAEIASIEFKEQKLLLLTMCSRKGRPDSMFGLQIKSFPEGLEFFATECHAILPRHDIGAAFRAMTEESIRQMLAQRDCEPGYAYERRLAAQVKRLPPYVRGRPGLSGDRDAKQRARDNSMFQFFTSSGPVAYGGSKRVCPRVFYSVYQFDATPCPAVFLFYYEEVEEKPVVLLTQLRLGAAVLPYAADIGREEAETKRGTRGARNGQGNSAQGREEAPDAP